MSNFLNNLGLGVICEDEDTYKGFTGGVIAEGRVIPCYTEDLLFVMKNYKDAEFVVRAKKTEDEHKYEFVGLDTHCSGMCVWNTEVIADITPDDAESGERRLLLSSDNNGEGHGLVVVNLINADVLPSYVYGDKVKMQVVGFPLFIEFFNDEGEYADFVPGEKEEKVLLGEGVIMPSEFMKNHHPDKGDVVNGGTDDICLVRGTVKKMLYGRFEDEDRKFQTFVRVLIETYFGDLEMEVDIKELDESDNKNIKVGATVFAGIILSGDVAIYEYENGFIADEDHDLMLFRHTIMCGEAKRLRKRLASDVTYISNVGKWEKRGRNEVSDLFQYIYDVRSTHYKAHLANLIVPETDENLEYSPGKHCLVMENEKEELESIMFLSYNDSNEISKVQFINDSRYRFSFD